MSRPPPGKFLRPTRLTSVKRVNRCLFLCLSALLFLPLFLLRCILFTSPTWPQGATDLHYPSSLSEKRCHPCWELWPVSGRILTDPVQSVLGAVTEAGVQEPSGKPGWWACPRTYRETMLENSPCSCGGYQQSEFNRNLNLEDNIRSAFKRTSEGMAFPSLKNI